MMSKMKFFIAIAVLSGAGFFVAQAKEDTDAVAIDKIKAVLKKELPQLNDVVVAKSALPDIYEVRIGQNYFYFTKDARYFFRGDLIDIKNSVNISDEGRKQIRKQLVKKLVDEKKVIAFKSEKESTQVTVFTDIDCTFCQKFHQEMKDINEQGISVNYVFFPRSGFPSASYDKAIKVWCAEDRNSALSVAKKDGEYLGPICQDGTIREHLDIVKELGINATPYIILEDGSTIKGYLPASQLKGMVDKSKTEKETRTGKQPEKG